MQGIYTYIPEANYVPREYSVAVILLLLFMVLVSLVSVLNLLNLLLLLLLFPLVPLVQSQASPCGICAGKNGTGIRLCPSTPVLRCQYH